MKNEKLNQVETLNSKEEDQFTDNVNQNFLEIPSPDLEFDDNAEEIQPSKKKSIILSNIPTHEKNTSSDLSEEQQKRKEELEKIQIRKTQANVFEKYLSETGIASAFELIFSEMITKKIPPENQFNYTAGRLRQIGRGIELIKQKNK